MCPGTGETLLITRQVKKNRISKRRNRILDKRESERNIVPKTAMKQNIAKLSISDKTISKWERGNGFPEVSFLFPLSNELEITVNELLSGERLQAMDYKKKAEENMVNLVKEAQERKKKIIMSAMVGVLVIVAAVPLFVLRECLKCRYGLECY